MSSWTDGYVADMGYTYGFYRELTPNLLRFVALCKGFRPRSAPKSYCELGCGQGFSTNLLAAANPGTEFFATDFNASQIAGASALAEEARTSNVHFYDASFAEFGGVAGLPAQFDCITLHGIYSWINEANRNHIVSFIRDRLKPGGIVYISYNTMPGWAAALPMRRLMVEYAGSGPTSRRIEEGLAFAAKLKDAGSRYFAQNSSVVGRFEKLKESNRNYLAHEYFNRDWTPFFFRDVAADMSRARLSFLASAHIIDHLDVVNFTPAQLEVIKSANAPDAQEELRDFILNQQFRRDVFARGSVMLSSLEARQIWLTQRFALSVSRKDVPMTVKGALGDATLQADVYGPLLDELEKGPASVHDMLQESAALSSVAWPSLIQALAVLVGSGHVQPCSSAEEEERAYIQTRAFNQALCARAVWSSQLNFLASPVTGGGVAVDRISQMFLNAIDSAADDPVQHVFQVLKQQGHRVMKDGAAVESDADGIVEIGNRYRDFCDHQLPVYRQLRLV